MAAGSRVQARASAGSPRVGAVFGGLMLAMVLASLDQTIVSTWSAPKIPDICYGS